MPSVRYHLGKFPPKQIEWADLVPLIGRANASLARYDGLVAAIPNASVLLSPLTTQEAVLSSKIEGTNVTMGEVLEIEAGGDGNLGQPKREDAEEIRNYRRALSFAAHAIRERPLTQHLLREVHALLMEGVRGRDKDPGAFRNEQNWIGPQGCTIEEANFVPIPQEHLTAGLDIWSGFMSSEKEPDPLVQLAIVHAEFEALHPFKDGNGRLGRMIIPLFLFSRKILSGPNFYMSGYLEERREEYVESMRGISRDDAWTQWCAFFLEGIIDQASENQHKAQSILKLHQGTLARVVDITHSQFAARAVDFIFSRPIFSSTAFTDGSGIPRATALRFLTLLRDNEILQQIQEGSGRRPAIFAFPSLINVAEGRDIL
ncbi:Fic/DOC family N-terminal domain-containing protein [Devosia sp. 2618]|uniref:Fic family protein n=1 Tax=Devosia sp. 2618 TaxID=3156454 RepID=UPI0033978CF9